MALRNVKALKGVWLALATGLGVGYAPIASGTFGTALAVPIVWAMGAYLPGWVYFVVTVAFLVLGAESAYVAEKHYEQRDSGKIVVDEIVGFMVSMYLVPISGVTLLAGFFAFRFFDIVKLWPARKIDREMEGGWGVMLDDVAAGVYTNIALQIFLITGLKNINYF